MRKLSSNRAGEILLALVALASTPALGGCGGKVVVDGSPSSGSGGSGGAPSASCTTQPLTVSGSLDGVPLDVASQSLSGLSLPGILTLTGDDAGKVIFLSSTCSPQDVTCSSDVGMIRVPFVPPAAGKPSVQDQGLWICDETGPTFTIGDLGGFAVGSVLFASPRRLGTCPGVPVSGQLTRCDKAAGCTLDGLSGTVAGQPVNAVSNGGANSKGAVFESDYEGRGLLLSGPTLDPGVFLMPDGSADPGAIYCIGSVGSDPVTGNPVLGSLSRLGTCAEAKPITGSVTVCLGG